MAPLQHEGWVGSGAILIIWPNFMSISLDSAGNVVGSKKNVVPNFMFVIMGGRVELAQIPSLEGTRLCLQKTHRSAKPAPSYFPGGTLLVRERI